MRALFGEDLKWSRGIYAGTQEKQSGECKVAGWIRRPLSN